jgi:hypothetical protein
MVLACAAILMVPAVPKFRANRINDSAAVADPG